MENLIVPALEKHTLNIWNPYIFLLTWGGAGLLRPAPGTWGSLAALPFALLIHSLAGGMGLIAGAALLYMIGFFAIRHHERTSGQHDGSYIVLDEVIGIFITLSVAHINIIDVVAGFFLFRAFDALKPGIIGQIDREVPGAHGVLLDDVFAGALAALCVVIIHVIT